MTTAALPCPFCGGDAELKYDSGNEVWGQSFGYGCKKCWASTPKHHGSSSWRVEKKLDDAAKTTALKQWNRRSA